MAWRFGLGGMVESSAAPGETFDIAIIGGGVNGCGIARDAEFASVIRIDGRMSASDWTMQFLADISDAQVDRPEIFETTALGAGYLAGWQAGLYPEPDEFAKAWRRQVSFMPSMASGERESRYCGWRDAVARTVMRPEI